MSDIKWKGTLKEFKVVKQPGPHKNQEVHTFCEKCGIPISFKYATAKNYKKDRFLCTKCSMEETHIKNFGSLENYREHINKVHKEYYKEHFGVEHQMQLQEVKDKLAKTNIERYGVSSGGNTKEGREKARQTCLKKYGVEHPAQYEAFKEKSRQTCLEKYGVENGNQSYKAKETCLKKYGVTNPNYRFKDKEALNIFLNKDNLKQFLNDNYNLTTLELADILGVSSYALNGKLHEYNLEEYIGRNNKKSNFEEEVYSFIYNLIPNEKIIRNDRSIISPKELDIYIPERQLAIECNGNYWHSEEELKNRHLNARTYHQNKTIECLKNSIHLIHIFEYEWESNKDLIKQYIKDILNIDIKTIYARKCIIRELDYKTTKEFLDNNHLQKSDKAPIRLGLYYENELIACMTFSKPRFNKTVEYELSRFVNKIGYRAVGGASKLLKYFERNYKPSSLISYCNITKMKGILYSKLGFNFINISEPNYVWYKYGDIKTRYQCQIHKLRAQGFEGSSEKEIMENLKYIRIYDSGNLVFIKNY